MSKIKLQLASKKIHTKWLVEKHLTHQSEVRKRHTGYHGYELWCRECQIHLQWISKEDGDYLESRGLVVGS